jgi:aminoglycoside 3'-phosphotransferase I
MDHPKPPAELIGALRAQTVDVGESGCLVLRLNDAEGCPQAFLKHGEGSLADAVIDELVRLRWLATYLPVPEVLGFTGTAGSSWLKTSALAGESAKQLLERGAQDPKTIVESLAEFMSRVHTVPVDACPFSWPLALKLTQARRRIDAGLIRTDLFEPEWRDRSAEDLWRDIQAELPLAPDLVVTHGDFSLDNILLDGGQVVGCIDVGGAGVADRHQDLAICWADLAEFGPALQTRFLAAYGQRTVDAQKLNVYRLLNELF